MPLVTCSTSMVQSHGPTSDAPFPEDGYVDCEPAMRGGWVWGDNRVSRGSKTLRVVDGESTEDAYLVPGPWRIRHRPAHGAVGRSFEVELTDDMPQPVNLATLEPVIDWSGEKWAVGPAGPSAYDLAVKQGYTGTLSDWLDSLQGEDGRAGTDGQDGEDGHTPVLTWQDTSLVVDGAAGPDLRGPAGEDGADGRDGEDGPAPDVSWTGDRLTVGGQTSPALTGPPGPEGTIWLTGAGAPSGVTDPGGLYLDTTTGDIYRFST